MSKDRRQDLRIPFNKVIEMKNIFINDQYVELPKPIKVTIVNLSCSGILLSTYLNLPPEICFSIDFIFNNEKIVTNCSVVYKEQLVTEIWNYGCKFLQTEETSSSKLRGFVFEQQIMFRNTNRRSG